MTEKHHIIPVWFFVGILLLVYGVLIFISGLAEWSHPPDTVLSELHPAVWWGMLLMILGSVYCLIYRPGKTSSY
jgi:FtsH-binding integral membrane protein